MPTRALRNRDIWFSGSMLKNLEAGLLHYLSFMLEDKLSVNHASVPASSRSKFSSSPLLVRGCYVGTGAGNMLVTCRFNVQNSSYSIHNVYCNEKE